MTNQQFIKEYGIQEFYALNDQVYIQLSVLKAKRKIKHFICSNRKKRATIYFNGGLVKVLDYATIIIEDIFSYADNTTCKA